MNLTDQISQEINTINEIPDFGGWRYYNSIL